VSAASTARARVSAGIASGWTKQLTIVPPVSAPAFARMRPAPIAPRCRFWKNARSHCARSSGGSASERARDALEYGRTRRLAGLRVALGEHGAAQRLLIHGGLGGEE
jgi:hypothetical protein